MPDSVRHLRSLKENMEHHHAELLQAVDKARIVCNEASNGNEYRCPLGCECKFHGGNVPTLGCVCRLDEILEILKKEKN